VVVQIAISLCNITNCCHVADVAFGGGIGGNQHTERDLIVVSASAELFLLQSAITQQWRHYSRQTEALPLSPTQRAMPAVSRTQFLKQHY